MIEDILLDRLYRRIPKLECAGKCQKSCSPPPHQDGERMRIFRRTLHYLGGTSHCNQLEPNGRCGVYDIRPLVCRLFGVAESMKCPFGCVPERYLSDAECAELFAEAARVAGETIRVIPPEALR